MVSESLESLGVNPIWFNAWKYDREENLWAALLQRILDQVTVAGSWRKRVGIKLRIWWDTIDLRGGFWANVGAILLTPLRLTFSIAAIALAFGWKEAEIAKVLQPLPLSPHAARALLGIVGFIATKPGDFIKLTESKLGLDLKKFQRERSFRDHISFLDEFSGEFQRIVRLASGGLPLVIIIDDLDRCLPEKSVAILEALKQFLDVPGCVFLVALDNELVERSVEVKYKDVGKDSGNQPNDTVSTLGASYIEKIIQLPLSIPQLSYERVIRFVNELYPDPEARSCAEIFAVGLPPNPRKIKRVLRVFDFLRGLARERISKGTVSLRLLAKLVVMQHEFRNVHTETQRQPSLIVALEVYSRGLSADESSSMDPVITQKARDIADRHPRIRLVLALKEADPAIDSFAQANLREYLYLLTTLTEVDRAQHVASALPEEGVWRDIVSRIVQHHSSLAFSGMYPLEHSFVSPRFRLLGRQRENAPESDLSLTEVMQTASRLLIVGAPGMGKSALLSFIATTLGRTWLESNSDYLADQLGLTEIQVPILITFRSLDKGRPLVEQIVYYLANYTDGINSRAVEEILAKGRCALLLDGLDEFGKDGDISRACEAISLLTTQYPGCRYVVTTRPLALPLDSLAGFTALEVQPWSQLQKREFIERLSSFDGSGTRAQVEEMLEKLPASLSASPLFLVLSYELYKNWGSLPVKRAELIELAIDTLFERERAKGITRSVSMKLMRVALHRLAFLTFETGRNTFNLEEVRRVFNRENIGEDFDLRELLASIFLVELAPGLFRFSHQSLQEYLAAAYLLEHEEGVRMALNHIADPEWREVLYYFGVMSREEGAVALISGMLDRHEYAPILLAGEIIIDRPSLPATLIGKCVEELQMLEQVSPATSNEHRNSRELLIKIENLLASSS
jgi:hypothetical protein